MTVGEPRPLLCTGCNDSVENYYCIGVKSVDSVKMHVNLALTSILDAAEMPEEMKLGPGTAVLHQWTTLGDVTSWEAGLISASSDDLILWRPEHTRGAVHLPTSKIIGELYTNHPAHSPNLLVTEPITEPTASPGRYEMVQKLRQTMVAEVLARNEAYQEDLKLHATEIIAPTTPSPEKILRPATTLDLLYILDERGGLRVDGWWGGKYQGFIAVEVDKPAGGWEPVFLNKTPRENSCVVFFASTRVLAMPGLNISELLH